MRKEKMIGLYIDTNQLKLTVEKGQEDETIERLEKYCGLDSLRQILAHPHIFTAYTYHYSKNQLGVTLKEYLET